MRVLVVYESMYGNTHIVASNVADGLRATDEVTLVPVADATADLVAGADLLVVGAPTHMHGMSTASSRQSARKAAAKPESGLTLDPDAGGPALRDWLSGLAGEHALAAAFDTRMARRPRVDRPRKPWPRQAAPTARLPPRHATGELPSDQAEHPGRRGVFARPRMGRGARGNGRTGRPCRITEELTRRQL